MKTREWL